MRPATVVRWIAVAMGGRALAAIALPSGASAQSAAEFFRGKRINIYVSSTVGGGYDQYARLLAKHIVRHIPGKPTIVVQNMVGAEGIKAAPTTSLRGPPQDGTAIGALSRNIGTRAALRSRQPGDPVRRPQDATGSARRSRRSDRSSSRPRRDCARIDDLKTREVTASLDRAQCADLGLSAHAQRALRHEDQGRSKAIRDRRRR